MPVTINGTTGITTPALVNGTALAFRNKIINGAMTIDQRNSGAAVANGFAVDRFEISNVTDGSFSGQRSTITPSGFINSLVLTTTSADSSLGATQFAAVGQKIEGFNVADLGWGTSSAQTVTLSFWVRSSLTGTFGGAFSNSSQNRSYPFNYSIISANTWEQKSIIISGDTTGTWLTDNGIGLRVYFGLGVGSTYSGTAGSWSGSFFISATGATSVVGTNGATFYITGVQLEAGSVATPFENRPIGTELALCQRYYYRTIVGTTTRPITLLGFANTTTLLQALSNFPVPMRIAPTSLEQTGTASDYNIVYGGGFIVCNLVPTFNEASELYARTSASVASGLTVGSAGYLRSNTINGYLGWSAEL